MTRRSTLPPVLLCYSHAAPHQGWPFGPLSASWHCDVLRQRRDWAWRAPVLCLLL